MEGHPTCRHVTLTSKPYSKLNKTAGWRSTIPAGGLKTSRLQGPGTVSRARSSRPGQLLAEATRPGASTFAAKRSCF